MHKDYEKLVEAIESLIEDSPEDVLPLVYEILLDDPNDVKGIHYLGYIEMMGERWPLAYIIFKRLLQLRPESEGTWANLGKCASEMHLANEAINYILKAIELKPDYARGYAHAAAELVKIAKYDEAIEYAKTCLEMEDNLQAKIHLGFAYLAKEDWARGWKYFDYGIGGMFRKETSYAGSTRFTGETGKTVVVYGEQGIGDEIMFSSMIPDAVKDNTIIMDCDPRLEGLFRRSFPKAEVHGTRRQPKLKWLKDKKIDHHCAAASLGNYYRRYQHEFHGESYLVADPERRLMWRALFDSWGDRPKVGVCWTGGTLRTNSKARTLELSDFDELFKLDADFISLEYKKRDLQGYPIREFKELYSDDYDDTAALVAELDCVIGIHTSVIHLAGALGVPAYVLVPRYPTWIYNNKMPWYNAVKLEKFRTADKWPDVIKRVIKKYLKGGKWKQ